MDQGRIQRGGGDKMAIRRSRVDRHVFIVVSLCPYDCEYEKMFVFGCFWERLKLISADIFDLLIDHRNPIF